MTFEDFVEAYTRGMKPKLKENTWNTKEAVINSNILQYFKDGWKSTSLLTTLTFDKWNLRIISLLA